MSLSPFPPLLVIKFCPCPYPRRFAPGQMRAHPVSDRDGTYPFFWTFFFAESPCNGVLMDIGVSSLPILSDLRLLVIRGWRLTRKGSHFFFRSSFSRECAHLLALCSVIRRARRFFVSKARRKGSPKRIALLPFTWGLLPVAIPPTSSEPASSPLRRRRSLLS